MDTAVKAMAKYITNTDFASLPPEVVRESKLRIADVIGIGLSGSKTKAAQIEHFCLENGGEGKATVWGSGKRTSPAFAALCNGTTTCLLYTSGSATRWPPPFCRVCSSYS